ncbi:MAG: hypothetical protein WC785_08865 [Tatlockia sp.]
MLNQYINQLIPGFNLLSSAEKEAFQQSKAGEKLIFSIALTLNVQNNAPPLQKMMHWFTSSNTLDLGILDDIKTADEYLQLLDCILFALIQSSYPELAILSVEQRSLLLNAPFSLNRKQQFLNILQKHIPSEKKDALLTEWYKDFVACEDMTFLKEPVYIKVGEAWAKKLANQLPLLNSNEAQEQFGALYFSYFEQKKETMQALTSTLHQFLFSTLNAQMSVHFNTVQFKIFNSQQAANLTEQVLASRANLDNWSEQYLHALEEELKQQWFAMDVLHWKKISEPFLESLKNSLKNSLSFLWNNRAVDYCDDFKEKLSDAHMFLQYTGLSSSSDSTVNSIMDIYNTGRILTTVSELKAIIKGLLTPFHSLYYEYRDIALHEKNVFWKIVRTVMPLVIAAGFIALLSAAMAPLLLPELAFACALVPLFFVGLAMAAQYVNLKNWLHEGFQSLRQWYYGGQYNIPEYQIWPVQKRMETLFGSLPRAQKVRNFYISAIKKCDATNIAERHALCLEWFDIRNNDKLPEEEKRVLVMERLRQTCERKHQTLTRVGMAFLNEEKLTPLNHNLKQIFTTGHPLEEVAPEKSHDNAYRFFERIDKKKQKVNTLVGICNGICALTPQAG